jgi:NADH:ubiquinone oxidoreductase subunit C
MKLDFLVLMYLSIFPQYIYSCTYQLMNIRLRLRNFYTFYNSCTFLKFMTMLKNFSLCDICVIDYPQNTNRFLFIYNL